MYLGNQTFFYVDNVFRESNFFPHALASCIFSCNLHENIPICSVGRWWFIFLSSRKYPKKNNNNNNKEGSLRMLMKFYCCPHIC